MPLPLKHLAILAFTILSVSAQEIRISASDLLDDFIREPLNAYAADNDVSFTIDGIGSIPAIDRLRANEIDMAIIAVPDGNPMPDEDIATFPFAYDVAIIAVNAGNPISEITVSRLGGIFGENEELSYNTWGELGLSGGGSRSIKALAGQSSDSISLELFRHSVLQGGAMKSQVAMVKDDEIEGLMAGDPASIAILAGLPKSNRIKPLMIAESPDSPAFGPSEDNVHYGDYPIRLAFYIAYQKSNDANMKSIMRVLYSDEMANSLRENNFFALPDTIRRKLVIDLDLEN